MAVLNPKAAARAKGTNASIVSITPGGARKEVPRTTIFRGSSKGSGSVTINTAEGQIIQRISVISTRTGKNAVLERTIPATTEQTSKPSGQDFTQDVNTAATIRGGLGAGVGSDKFISLASKRAQETEVRIPSGSYSLVEASGLTYKYDISRNPYGFPEGAPLREEYKRKIERDAIFGDEQIKYKSTVEKHLLEEANPLKTDITYEQILQRARARARSAGLKRPGYDTQLIASGLLTNEKKREQVIEAKNKFIYLGNDVLKSAASVGFDREAISGRRVLENVLSAPAKIASIDKSINEYLIYTSERIGEAPGREALMFTEGVSDVLVIGSYNLLRDASPLTLTGVKMPFKGTARGLLALGSEEGFSAFKQSYSEKIYAEPSRFLGELIGTVFYGKFLSPKSAKLSISGVARGTKNAYRSATYGGFSRKAYANQAIAKFELIHGTEPVGTIWNNQAILQKGYKGIAVKYGDKNFLVYDQKLPKDYLGVHAGGTRRLPDNKILLQGSLRLDLDKIKVFYGKQAGETAKYVGLHEVGHATGFKPNLPPSKVSAAKLRDLYPEYKASYRFDELAADTFAYKASGIIPGSMYKNLRSVKHLDVTPISQVMAVPFVFKKGQAISLKFTSVFRIKGASQTKLLGGYVTPDKASFLSNNRLGVVSRTRRIPYTQGGTTKYRYITEGVEINPLKPFHENIIKTGQRTLLPRKDPSFLKFDQTLMEVSPAKIRVNQAGVGVLDDFSKQYIEVTRGSRYKLDAVYPNEKLITGGSQGVLVRGPAGSRYLFGSANPRLNAPSIVFNDRQTVLGEVLSKALKPATRVKQNLLSSMYGTKIKPPKTGGLGKTGSVFGGKSSQLEPSSQITSQIDKQLPKTKLYPRERVQPSRFGQFYDASLTGKAPVKPTDTFKLVFPPKIIQTPSAISSFSGLFVKPNTYNIIRSSILQAPMTDVSGLIKPSAKLRSDVNLEQSVIPRTQTKAKLNVRTEQIFDTEQNLVQITKNDFPVVRPTGRSGGRPKPEDPPPPGKRFDFPFLFPKNEKERLGTRKKRKGKRVRRYNPSITSIEIGVFGKPSDFGISSGLGIRPVPRRKKL